MIVEIKGNIWDFHAKGHFITVTTNGNLKANGAAIMGKGIALEAKERFPELPHLLGQAIKESGNVVMWWPDFRIITVPTKHNWYDRSPIDLVTRSVGQLIISADTAKSGQGRLRPIYCVKFGCGKGGLDWEGVVKPALDPFIDPMEFVFVCP